ncbi:ABC-type multidrug transport system permease subunit [Okibacterium sp. HSC-33S16]|uniref:ABC transporter permease n=1 Tax=Okibacterium sp. HSC-33S16 TaxID=2910965 RepID=UPI0020A07D9C|nr:ABC transporter permease [Okibacterium sp. HSC-33S16]MCP2031532.1 ABC-type multidrug transport system permease subunit [Okibacterium sp. HSC-33S16]
MTTLSTPRSSALRNGWILTQRELLHWERQPALPIFGLLFSIMLLLMFGFLFGGAIEVPGGGDYITFLLPGMFTLTMLFGVESTMLAMSTDAAKGITDRFRSMPIHSSAVALGRCGADMASSVLNLAVLLVGGLLIGWQITTDLGSALVGVLLLIWLRFAVLWVGIFLGLTFRNPAATMAVQVLIWPVGFLSNVFVAPETMPAWLGAVAAWNPISATATATRQLFGNPTGITTAWMNDSALLMATAWPLVLTLVFLPLSARAYRRLRR